MGRSMGAATYTAFMRASLGFLLNFSKIAQVPGIPR